MFEDLLTKAFKILYEIEENKEYVFDNLELIERCINRADIIYQEQQNNNYLLFEAISNYEDKWKKSQMD
jgi:hypothetical protein